uniref:Cyclin L (projected from Caenorhabditis elegans ortholog cyl-1) n=1 Tax=Strongyloides venezuelensis TaxID=75913 RepID=A0A0K0FNP5_STRVS
MEISTNSGKTFGDNNQKMVFSEGKTEKEKLESLNIEKIRSKIKPSSFGLKPNNSSVCIDSDKWYLTLQESSKKLLANPPSIVDGIPINIEQELRYLGCELIQSLTILLKMPQTAAATGQILYQRFYYQKSFAKYYFEHAVMACVLLASKIEENPRRCREVINTFDRMKKRHALKNTPEENNDIPPIDLDQHYVHLKNIVIKTERLILKTLGFVVYVNHPHKWIYVFAHALKQIDNSELIGKAWSYMNDGLRTDIFLRYQPNTIACACLFLASRTISSPISLPKKPRPWYEIFDVQEKDVIHISKILLLMYNRCQSVDWIKLRKYVSKICFPDKN